MMWPLSMTGRSSAVRCALAFALAFELSATSLALAGPPPAGASPKPATAPLTFPDAHRLDNGLVTLAVSPRVGRAVWFGPTGGPNILWINTPAGLKGDPTGYRQVGGNKLWTTPQMMWGQVFHQEGGWPPDGVIDGRPWMLVEADRQHLVIQSQASSRLGLRARRSFELVPGQPAMRVVNTLTCVSANIFPSQLWSVTELPHPRFVLMGIAKDRPASARPWVSITKPIKLMGHVTLIDHDRALKWDLPKEAWKIGTLGRWVAGVFDDLVLVQSTSFNSRGAYPDGANMESWTGGDFTEIELLSGMRHLQPGESMSNVVMWRLLPRKGRSAKQLAQAIDQTLSQQTSDAASESGSGDTK